MELRKFIATTIREYLNESYKLTFNDKQAIEKNVKNEYEKYKNSISRKNNEIESAKKSIEMLKLLVDKGEFTENQIQKTIDQLNLDYISKIPYEKLILYNQFYKENIEYITQDYINYKIRNATTTFNYKSKNIKNNEYEEYYNTLTNIEKQNIKEFLNIVAERIHSGTGESIDRKEVRDIFFKTPLKFQKMFSEKPSPYLWRGDYTHPCNDDYNHNDVDYLSMQSFSINKNTAKEFGFHFSANNIKNYSGSFSIPLYVEYGGDIFDLGDDEGEVMFFDVTYKCKNKTK
jgi:hypothetical protein